MKVVGLTNIGLVRKRNEDAYLIDTDRSLFLVCDGMGGHRGGDVASKLATETINRELKYHDLSDLPQALKKAVQIANQTIWETGKNDEELNEMGTTITAAVVWGEQLLIAHVGDSSLLIIRGDEVIKPTYDHTLAEQMLRDGLIDKYDERYRSFHHVLTRALGVDKQVDIDLHQIAIQTGDWILICTDGLSNMIDQQEILNLLREQHEPQEASQLLLD
jgi:PPM family protein phosphatase